MPAPCAAGFEHAERTNDVARRIRLRSFLRVAYTGLSREMYGYINLAGREQGIGGARIGQVEQRELETRMNGELSEAIALQLRIVIGIQIVDTNDFVATRKQLTRNVIAN